MGPESHYSNTPTKQHYEHIKILAGGRAGLCDF